MQHEKFQKFSGGACPRTPLELSWFLNQHQISSAEKHTLEKTWKLCPPLLKFLATPLPSLVVDEKNLVIGFAPPPPLTLEMLPPSLGVWEHRALQLLLALKTRFCLKNKKGFTSAETSAPRTPQPGKAALKGPVNSQYVVLFTQRMIKVPN